MVDPETSEMHASQKASVRFHPQGAHYALGILRADNPRLKRRARETDFDSSLRGVVHDRKDLLVRRENEKRPHRDEARNARAGKLQTMSRTGRVFQNDGPSLRLNRSRCFA